MSLELQTERTETALPLTLAITQPGSGGLTGQSPTVRIRNGETDDSYLDFADNTFKTAGWTTQDAALDEIGDGFYLLTGGLNVAAFEASIPTVNHLYAEYEVPGIGVDIDVILLREKVYTA